LAGEAGPAIDGVLATPAWEALARAAGRDPASLMQAAARRGFRPIRLAADADIDVRTHIRRYRSANVIGRIEGRERPGEAIVYTAHWDHLGICRARGVTDRVCNGAIDNASGVALMIEIARALANGRPPQRSLMFVATTAEELGLLGARAFLADPPVPLRSILADLNLDTVAIAPRGTAVSIVGRGRTPLDILVDDTARSLGRAIDPSLGPNAYLARQDGWEFSKRGIPAIMVSSAFTDATLLNRFFNSDYHGPRDDISRGIELGGAVEDGALQIELGRVLADPARFPTLLR
jgi:Zn-dependent M28 family amino/carboxypeptidase